MKHIWTSITSIFVITALAITITTSIPPVVVYATTINCLPGVNCIGTDNDDKIVRSSDSMTSMEKEAMVPLLVLIGFDIITGENGTDEKFGGKGSDELDGGDGNDKLDGGDGNDELSGGSGVDLIAGESG